MNKNDTYLGELTDFEHNCYVFNYTDNKLFFEDNRSIVQTNFLFPNTSLVCDWCRKEKDIDIQVVFPLTVNWDYNTYLIFIYYWAQNEVFVCGFRSLTNYPPVWDRSFSVGPDYRDYVAIQNFINKILSKNNIPTIIIDNNPVEKSFNTTQETQGEVKKLLQEGKSYTILSIKAESAFLKK